MTAFIIESYKILQPDPADTTVALLTRLVQSTGQSPEPETPPPFQVTSAALVCNVLWFISLALSLTCSLLATLVEQWAREFLHRTDIHPAPVRRARMFSFLYRGIQQFRMHAVVDVIPMLLHVSLFLFFGGLVAFLLPVNRVLMYLMATILAVFLLLYTALTALPVIRRASPYRTPLSGAFWKLRQSIDRYKNRHSKQDDDIKTHSMAEAVLHEALKDARERDVHAVQWTVACLTDDEELLRFTEAIPDALYGSKGFHNANSHLFLPLLNTEDPQISIGNRIVDLLRRTDDPSLDQPSRVRRQTACMKAIWALGMLADTTLFQRPLVFWFDRSAIDILGTKTLDPSFALSARAAVRYSRWIAVKACLQTLQDELDGCDQAPTDEIFQSILRIVDPISEEDIPPKPRPWPASLAMYDGYRHLFRELKAVQSEPPSLLAFEVVNDTVRGLLANWDARSFNISVEYVDAALTHILYPYGFDATLPKLLPDCPDMSWMNSYALFEELPDPSKVISMTSDIHALDKILQTLFRLCPIPLGKTLPLRVLEYIANRNSESALLFALSCCDTKDLQMAVALAPDHGTVEYGRPLRTSQAIWILCDLMHRDKSPFKKANLPDFVHALLPGVEYVKHKSTRAIVKHHALFDLRMLTYGTFMNGMEDPNMSDLCDAMVAILGDPLLSIYYKPEILSSSDFHELFETALDHLTESQLIVTSQLLSSCSTTCIPYKFTETMVILLTGSAFHFIDRDRRLGRDAQIALADGIHTIIGCIISAETPDRASEPAKISICFWTRFTADG